MLLSYSLNLGTTHLTQTIDASAKTINLKNVYYNSNNKVSFMVVKEIKKIRY